MNIVDNAVDTFETYCFRLYEYKHGPLLYSKFYYTKYRFVTNERQEIVSSELVIQVYLSSQFTTELCIFEMKFYSVVIKIEFWVTLFYYSWYYLVY